MSSVKLEKSAKAVKPILCLFDVDGTLTPPRKHVEPLMVATLRSLRQHCDVGIVGGSDLPKIKEQLGENLSELADYVFAENGVVAILRGTSPPVMAIQDYLGEEKLQEFINFCLVYMGQLKLPVKRGTFIEFRNGMMNVSPIGRNCSYAEREEFNRYDAEHGIRKKFVQTLQERFADLKLRFVIGGQISFDVFPEGWDKRFCLRHIDTDSYKEIHFFGDKTQPGENDYELYTSPLVKGHAVTGPHDTIRLLHELFIGGK